MHQFVIRVGVLISLLHAFPPSGTSEPTRVSVCTIASNRWTLLEEPAGAGADCNLQFAGGAPRTTVSAFFDIKDESLLFKRFVLPAALSLPHPVHREPPAITLFLDSPQ